MKSIVSTFLTLIFVLFFSALGNAASPQEEDNTQPRFRAGLYFEGFRTSDENLKDFYHHDQRNLPGLEASVHVFHNIDLWTSYRIYSDETKTTFYQHLSKFRLNTASLGVCYRPVVWGRFEPFIGAGMELCSYSERIQGASDLSGTSGNAAGYHIQTGTYIDLYKFLVSKVFIRYSGIKKSLGVALPDGTRSLDLGGLEFGLGILARF